MTVFGKINLDDDEITVLEKRPEYAVYQNVDNKRLLEEMHIALAKVRWERREKDWLEEGETKDSELSPEALKAKKTHPGGHSGMKKQMPGWFLIMIPTQWTWVPGARQT